MTHKVNILRAGKNDSPVELHSFKKKPTFAEVKELLGHRLLQIVEGRYTDPQSGASMKVELWCDEEGLCTNDPQKNYRASHLRWTHFKRIEKQLSPDWNDFAQIYGDCAMVYKESSKIKQNAK